jgi:amidase
VSTFITELDAVGSGPRVAIKDIIDVAGVPTTAGSRAVERTASPAAADARCLAGLRAAGARIVGKTNLHELAMLPLGTNPWFGTPVNPLDPDLIPGGSSSGSAVAVADGDADVALGSDTGGSIRIPSACCGTAGLKTTFGRIPLDGFFPLAPSFDTIGPMARDIDGLVLGMSLLEPGFRVASAAATTIGRVRTGGDPVIEAAIDAALREAGFEVVEIAWDELAAGSDAYAPVYFDEVWHTDHLLVERAPDEVGADILGWMQAADAFRPAAAEARQAIASWRARFDALIGRVELLALPTIPVEPPRIDSLTPESLAATVIEISSFATVFNAAGAPCTAQPVRTEGSRRVPASLQLVGPRGGEELLLATARVVETASGV